MNKKLVLFILISSLFIIGSGCRNSEKYNKNYIPDEGLVHLFIGQDLEAVGGIEGYNGYIDFFGMPAGITTYTGISDMDGLNRFTNYGAGDVWAKAYMDDEKFDNTMMAIGLYMVDDLEETIAGEYDHHLKELAQFIKEYKSPVFLRIGYEFNNGGNHYNPELYIEAFQYVCDYLDTAKVKNYVSVWQSDEAGSKEELIKWYPGDDYVDWCAYSYFNQSPETIGVGMLEVAREHEKPVMIAEATPRMDIFLEDNFVVWHTWYKTFLQHVRDNMDVVKSVSYINCRWRTQEMWKGKGWGDSRLQLTEYYAQQWVEELKSGIWNIQTLIEDTPTYIKTPEDEYPPGTLLKGESIKGAIEAETQEGIGNVVAYDDSFASGGKGMAYIYEDGDRLNFKNMPQSNKIMIRYASNIEEATSNDTQTGTIGLFIDGVRVYDLGFESTGSWVESYTMIDVELDITNGATFSIGFEEGDVAMNVDCIVPRLE